jgi:hypothetical protein
VRRRLLVRPRFGLEAITAQEWEIGILRFVGFATAALGLLWEGARPTHGQALARAQQKALIAWVLLAVFLVGNTSLLLICGFTLLMAAALELGLERAVTYSEAFRRRLEPPP